MKAGLGALLIAAVFSLGGCATTSGPAPAALLPVSVPCPATRDSQATEPPEFFNLDRYLALDRPARYAANRAEWIGYARALRTDLDACK